MLPFAHALIIILFVLHLSVARLPRAHGDSTSADCHLSPNVSHPMASVNIDLPYVDRRTAFSCNSPFHIIINMHVHDATITAVASGAILGVVEYAKSEHSLSKLPSHNKVDLSHITMLRSTSTLRFV